MFEKEIAEYEKVVESYKEKIADKMAPGDYMVYNEILFSAHSCGIEGNTFTVDETRTLKEKGLGMIPQGKTLLEAMEMLDHFRAYEYLLSNLDKPLTEDLLKETHRLLMDNTMAYRTAQNNPGIPGTYTTTDMAAGDTVFGDHTQLIKRVPVLLQSTQDALDKGETHPMIISARFHGYFESLHPFRDGNGRLGRLFSNFILLKKDKPLLIIEREDREGYIKALRMIRTERTDEYLISFFFQTAIRNMQKALREKKDMTQNFTKDISF
ncbi:MAG: Fic family protein [Tannerellaceae bacterium]|nr:Fic family protein [Tannerellaceae bacterium]